jgi:metal-dependent amidase/aminoacylase/carboxypeptidase family protein
MTISSDLKKKILHEIEVQVPSLLNLYRHLHAHPELSGQETQTARRVAEELSAQGNSFIAVGSNQQVQGGKVGELMI